MLLCWIRPDVIGITDSPHWLLNAAWCMAKIRRLFPDWELPMPDEVEKPILQVAVRIARRISQEELPVKEILPIQEEMQKIEMPQQLRDLLGLMLVTNPDKRPSASAVLASNEFRAFGELVGA
jgi:serine/threonine protein kinase